MDLSEPNPPHDYSYIWLPAIEEHEQNRHADSDLKAILAIGIREAALQALDEDSSILPELISILEGKNWAVFERNSLFLLSQSAKDYPDIVAEKLTNKLFFEDESYKHEYALLAQAGFGLIGAGEKQEILSWIKTEPSDEDIEEYSEWYFGQHGSKLTDDELEAYASKRKMNLLWQFQNALPEEWKERFDGWVQQYGEPEHPDFSCYSSSTWVGPTSPMPSEDLKKMSVAEIVDYLKSWQPPEGHFVETPEGLSRTLAQAVSDDPIRFALESMAFAGLDPTYVRGFIDGLRDAPKNRDDIPWQHVLELCQWVVEQPREIPGRKAEYSDIDPGWVWARKSIANLLNSGLKSGLGEIPVELREQVWPVLEVLTDDPDPSHEEYGEGHMDPSQLSINSVRGEAMHAVVEYGLWVYRNSEVGEKSFDLIPELRVVLAKHLNIDIDPSLAIRSVYGRWFPWLNLIDHGWAEENKRKIFSPDPARYWDAAWKTYITFCQPFDDVFAVLKDQYALAIDKLGQPSEIEIDIANAEKRLAEHLMAFYGRGKLQLDDDLMIAFYEKASLQLRAHAIEFLGRSLGSSDVPLPEGYEDRLHRLWEWRFTQATENGEPDELADFCWWFSSGKLDEDWALFQLKAVLVLPTKGDSLDFAAEQLVKVAARKPMPALECLNLMLNKLGEVGIYFGWNDEAKQILGEAMKSQDEAVKALATAIINRLGAMGYFEFREFL